MGVWNGKYVLGEEGSWAYGWNGKSVSGEGSRGRMDGMVSLCRERRAHGRM